MSAIKFACVCPHPPVIVPEVGQGREADVSDTVEAMQKLGAELALHRPDTALLMATHGPLNPGAFFLLSAPNAEGDFARWGAPGVHLSFEIDSETVAAVQEEGEAAGLPLDSADRWDSGLDWSCTVPLYFLRCGMPAARLVAMNIAFLSPQEHFQFGRAVRRAVDRLGRRAVIIASADLSHRLSPDGPYGFDPAGPEFDRRIREAVEQWDVDAVLNMQLTFREAAGDDAVPSLSFLMGALDGLPVRPRILSYEGPFGVGYMVAAVDILDGATAPAGEETEAAVTEPLESVSSAHPEPALSAVEGPVEGRANPSHPLVRLARDAVEAFVLRREVIATDGHLGSRLPPRGCFVSIKTQAGELRGCIGSVEPVASTLAAELIRNAIDCAAADPRFLPITADELTGLVFSVDLLSPPEPIDGLHQLDPRRYGVIVHNPDSGRGGLLLPDIEGVDSVEQQVAIAKSKALIAPDEPVHLWRFEVDRLT